MKFKLQTEDEINGNNSIANALGTGAQRRYQMCKTLLSKSTKGQDLSG